MRKKKAGRGRGRGVRRRRRDRFFDGRENLTCFLLDSEPAVEDVTLTLTCGQETEPETELAPGLGCWSCLIFSAISSMCDPIFLIACRVDVMFSTLLLSLISTSRKTATRLSSMLRKRRRLFVEHNLFSLVREEGQIKRSASRPGATRPDQ